MKITFKCLSDNLYGTPLLKHVRVYGWREILAFCHQMHLYKVHAILDRHSCIDAYNCSKQVLSTNLSVSHERATLLFQPVTVTTPIEWKTEPLGPHYIVFWTSTPTFQLSLTAQSSPSVMSAQIATWSDGSSAVGYELHVGKT